MIMSPSILGRLALILELYEHFDDEVVETTLEALSQAFLSSNGFFDRENNHRLSAIAPLYDILLKGAVPIIYQDWVSSLFVFFSLVLMVSC